MAITKQAMAMARKDPKKLAALQALQKSESDEELVIPPQPESVEERISYFTDLMVRGKFVTGFTYEQVARAWGVPPSTVRKYTCEASRRIRAEVNTDEIRAQVIATLQTITQSCLDDKAQSRDLKNAIRALEAIGRVIGSPRPTIQISGGGSGTNNIQIVMMPPEDPRPSYAQASTANSTTEGSPVAAESGPANSLLGV